MNHAARFVRCSIVAIALCGGLGASAIHASTLPTASPPHGASADGAWSELSIIPPTEGATAVYDAINDRLIVFGGLDYSTYAYSNRTWALPHGGHWMLLDAVDPANPIPAMSGAAAIYDPLRHRVVLFGYDSRTWQLDLTQPSKWEPFPALSPSPTPRTDGIAVYDPYQDRLVLYGGSEQDVWSFALSGPPAWRQLAPTGTPPPASASYAGALDIVGGRLLVTNGASTWELQIPDDPVPIWYPIPVTAPIARRDFADAVYDTAGRQLVLFGGFDTNGYPTNDAYALPTGGAFPLSWSTLAPTGMLPPARAVYAATFDPVRRTMIAFGGYGSTPAGNELPLADVYGLSVGGPPAWQPLASGNTGPPKWGGLDIGVYDAAGDQFVTVGTFDSGYFGSYSVAEALGLQTPAWNTITAFGYDGSMGIYDPVLEGVITYGGYDSHFGWYNTTGIYPLHDAPGWSLDPGPPAPSTSSGNAQAIYDPRRHRMVVYGAFPCCNGSQGWALSTLAPHVWSQFLPTDPAPPVITGLTIEDPVRDRMIVWDPSGANPWALDFASDTWSPVAASGTPPPGGQRYVGVYDPIRDRIVVWSSAGAWALGLSGAPAWTALAPAGTAPAPSEPKLVAAYDPVRDRMLVQLDDGPQGNNVTSNTYALTFGEPAEPGLHCIADETWTPGRKLDVGFGLTNGLSGQRAIGWSVTCDRSWPGFPMYGTLNAAGGASPSVTQSVVAPDTAVVGPVTLRMRAWYEGGQGNDATCDTDLRGVPTAVPIGGPGSLALAIESTNNPSRSLHVNYVLPRAGIAKLGAYDIGGRRVASLDVETTAGRHDARLGGATIAPGVYLVEIEQSGRTARARAVVVR